MESFSLTNFPRNGQLDENAVSPLSTRRLLGADRNTQQLSQMNYGSVPQVGITAITEDILKRKWSMTILRYIKSGISDPAEIMRHEGILPAKVLSERLRTMLRYKLIMRFPRPAPSSVIEYRLTPLGKKLFEMLNAIEELDQELAGKRNGADKIPPPAVATSKAKAKPELMLMKGAAAGR